MNKTCEWIQVADVLILKVHHLLGEYANRQLLTAAQQRIDAGNILMIVDLGSMPYTNSVGLNFLISLQARCQEKHGQIVLANASDKLMQLLEITKLQPLFQLTSSVEEALQLINQGERTESPENKNSV
ncbi:MAG: STAS domain-containing protein [Saprospiraceae bacterium]